MSKKTTKSRDKTEVKYPINELIRNCEALTGYKEEVAVGALFDCTEKELTKKEFEGRIKKFLNRRVK